MANNRSTYQQQHTVSIPKKHLIEKIACNQDLSEMDLRVALCLFTELDGFNRDLKRARSFNDPLNYTHVSAERIADILGVRKKKVKESIQVLLEEGIIEDGVSNGTFKGYRFTF